MLGRKHGHCPGIGAPHIGVVWIGLGLASIAEGEGGSFVPLSAGGILQVWHYSCSYGSSTFRVLSDKRMRATVPVQSSGLSSSEEGNVEGDRKGVRVDPFGQEDGPDLEGHQSRMHSDGGEEVEGEEALEWIFSFVTAHAPSVLPLPFR